MRKLFALALLALALAGGVVAVTTLNPHPAHADYGTPNCWVTVGYGDRPVDCTPGLRPLAETRLIP
jgi:hypothetical protein